MTTGTGTKHRKSPHANWGENSSGSKHRTCRGVPLFILLQRTPFELWFSVLPQYFTAAEKEANSSNQEGWCLFHWAGAKLEYRYRPLDGAMAPVNRWRRVQDDCVTFRVNLRSKTVCVCVTEGGSKPLKSWLENTWLYELKWQTFGGKRTHSMFVSIWSWMKIFSDAPEVTGCFRPCQQRTPALRWPSRGPSHPGLCPSSHVGPVKLEVPSGASGVDCMVVNQPCDAEPGATSSLYVPCSRLLASCVTFSSRERLFTGPEWGGICAGLYKPWTCRVYRTCPPYKATVPAPGWMFDGCNSPEAVVKDSFQAFWLMSQWKWEEQNLSNMVDLDLVGLKLTLDQILSFSRL